MTGPAQSVAKTSALAQTASFLSPTSLFRPGRSLLLLFPTCPTTRREGTSTGRRCVSTHPTSFCRRGTVERWLQLTLTRWLASDPHRSIPRRPLWRAAARGLGSQASLGDPPDSERRARAPHRVRLLTLSHHVRLRLPRAHLLPSVRISLTKLRQLLKHYDMPSVRKTVRTKSRPTLVQNILNVAGLGYQGGRLDLSTTEDRGKGVKCVRDDLVNDYGLLLSE